ncbi:MAG: hypothetical protein ACOX1R_10065 [Caldicoprobacterales bacterium]|nr:hypothetical protein [Clostridiales bacterium]
MAKKTWLMECRKAVALSRTLKAASFRQDAGLEALGFSNERSLSFLQINGGRSSQ